MSNIYPPGQCTWWCANQAPWVMCYGNLGNARDWANNWAKHGGIVATHPTDGNVVCFQPGADGADAGFGHVAVVVGSGVSEFLVSEMNGPAGAGHTDDRLCQLVPGVSFLVEGAPPIPQPEDDDVKPILATTKRTTGQGPDPHGAGAVYLVADWPYGPKRWITNPAYLAPYEAVCGALQTVDPFLLDRIEEGPHIDTTANPSEA